MTIRKILMAGVAGTVLAAAPVAMAQTQSTTPQASTTMPAATSVSADKLIGKSVRNPSGDKIGDIEAVYVSQNGQIDSVILGVGGFLGIGERDVAVKWSDLTVSDNGDKITATMTKDSLKALPEYTWKDKSYRGKVFSDAGVQMTPTRRADTATPGGVKPGPADTARPNTTASPRDTVATDTPRTDRPLAADRAPIRSEPKGFTKTGEVSGDALIGATVKNKANETVGEIKDIHLNKDGSVKAAVVGVGGFLGVGERDVLLPWTDLQIATNPDNDLAIETDATKDSLKAMPEYRM